ncbi:adenine phosphoribosyltransferase [Streptomonospora nanhaiensis]|uniref:Adenine phosphoribosyltransferase n=1 Tax=Streptomonospora nanhaiensis TaxID=1323731 RepID=A0A853BXB5_9ACTN|nr:adenine phosphoribosyltransferase [Streptomonospora nanhaiensis]MBV2364868.1 adenine phosphoribosyltransferase [Streptomonospora nanhaiensis]MBX9387165.1 adenine phosphoribosyltransferase [Streptomonospora nanhaiensis]NYI98812.1 adenine phosphoribosyltransferase [Streptomonospora nanhaiensis]
MSADLSDLIKAGLRDVPDFPRPGVVFKDITGLLADSASLRAVVEGIAGHYAPGGVDTVLGLEARGFILGAPVALELGAGFVPVRKAGKLPRETYQATYDLEYGSATVEIHTDAVRPGSRVLIVDDVLATGGTGQAAVRLVRQAGGTVVGFSVLIELGFLEGRRRLTDVELHALAVL